MKKRICFTLVLVLLMTLAGCKMSNTRYDEQYWSTYEEATAPTGFASVTNPTVSTPTSAKKKAAAKRTTAAKAKKTEAVILPDISIEQYDAACRSVSKDDWEKIRILDRGKGLALQLEIPYDWSISKKNTDTLNIVCDNDIIGTIQREALSAGNADFRFGHYADVDDRVVYAPLVDKTGVYRCYEWQLMQKGVTFTVNIRLNYIELDEKASLDFMNKLTVVSRQSMIIPLSESNGSDKILLLGNKHLEYSKVDAFLNDMFINASNGYSAESICINDAGVTAFKDHYGISRSISGGSYGYVFLCGLYSARDVRNVAVIRECCEASGTELVIFPAHDESIDSINEALNTYTDLPFLDWRGEIDELIIRGGEYSDYRNNGYGVSLPLAGYVGAHMIYRRLFGDPPLVSYDAPLNQRYIESKLYDYVQNGGVLAGYNDAVEEKIPLVAFG